MLRAPLALPGTAYVRIHYWLHPKTSFLRDRRGGVSILSALMFLTLLGFAALAAEFGMGLERQTENQRIADLAAFAAANYYGANSGAANALAQATTIAQNVAILNGATASGVTVSLYTPAGSSKQAIKVQVQTKNALLLAPLLGSVTSLSPTAISAAQLGSPKANGCITALNGSGGIVLSGGASIFAPDCGVDSNASINVPCGTSVTAKSVTYGGSPPSTPCNGLTAGSIANAPVTDPLAGASGVSAAQSRLGAVAAITAPAAPTVPAGAIAFNLAYWPTTTQASGGCTATFAAPSAWTIACPAGATYNFASLVIAGGVTLNFNPTGSAATTYNFSANVANTGAAMTFGPGNYTFAQGLTTGGGATTTFTASGIFAFGAGPSCNGQGNYSICANSALTFAGTSAFSIARGVYVAGGATLAMGSGAGNSYQIGAASDGNAIWVGGGATLTLADATSGAGLFQLAGNFNATAGGGSCVTLGAATQHDINGSFATAGGTVLGAGIYTLNGSLAFGQNSGGSVSCNGQMVGLKGAGVTIAYSAATTTNGGPCVNDGVCFANGFNYVNLSAPTGGATAGLLLVGPSSGSAGAVFTGGSGAVMSGAFYMPLGDFNMSGGASINTPTGGCLQIVAATIELSGGTTAASTCVSNTAVASSSSPKVIQ